MWDILDIKPTKDKKLIKKAYAAKLKSISPEDDPEGFQALREAYEWVLSHAKDESHVSNAGNAIITEPKAFPNPKEFINKSEPKISDVNQCLSHLHSIKPDTSLSNWKDLQSLHAKLNIEESILFDEHFAKKLTQVTAYLIETLDIEVIRILAQYFDWNELKHYCRTHNEVNLFAEVEKKNPHLFETKIQDPIVSDYAKEDVVGNKMLFNKCVNRLTWFTKSTPVNDWKKLFKSYPDLNLVHRREFKKNLSLILVRPTLFFIQEIPKDNLLYLCEHFSWLYDVSHIQKYITDFSLMNMIENAVDTANKKSGDELVDDITRNLGNPDPIFWKQCLKMLNHLEQSELKPLRDKVFIILCRHFKNVDQVHLPESLKGLDDIFQYTQKSGGYTYHLKMNLRPITVKHSSSIETLLVNARREVKTSIVTPKKEEPYQENPSDLNMRAIFMVISAIVMITMMLLR